MKIEFKAFGIYLPEIDLWLDNTDPCAATWISHGHSDHARGCHGRAIGTPETLRCYRMRLYLDEGQQEPHLVPLPYHQSMDWNGAKLTAFPAAHIVGAAQLLIEYGGERLVYTGDIKLRPPLCGANTEIVPCDRLIIESTFGLPIFHFLPREDAAARILDFARECLQDGYSPAFIGYGLGRGQEIVHVLTTGGIPTVVHGAIAKFIPVYESRGYAFPGWEPYDARRLKGKAIVVVPSHGPLFEAGLKKIRMAYVSGWAMSDNARKRSGAEVLIPYSDHAGFDELIEMIEGSGATHVDLVHGYTTALCNILRGRGINAFSPVREEVSTDPEAEG